MVSGTREECDQGEERGLWETGSKFLVFSLNEQTCVNLCVDNEVLMRVAVGLNSATKKKNWRVRDPADAIGDGYDLVWTTLFV